MPEIVKITGTAHVFRDGKWILLKKGMKTKAGETINTKRGGTVVVKGSDGSLTKVGPLSLYDGTGAVRKAVEKKSGPEVKREPKGVVGGIYDKAVNLDRLPEPRGKLDIALEDVSPLFEMFDVGVTGIESALRQTFQPGFDRFEFMESRLSGTSGSDFAIKGPLEAAGEVRGGLKIPSMIAAGAIEFMPIGGGKARAVGETLDMIPGAWKLAIKKAGKESELLRIVKLTKNPAEALSEIRKVTDDAGESIVGKLTSANLTQIDRRRISRVVRGLKGKEYDEKTITETFLKQPEMFVSAETSLKTKRRGDIITESVKEGDGKEIKFKYGSIPAEKRASSEVRPLPQPREKARELINRSDIVDARVAEVEAEKDAARLVNDKQLIQAEMQQDLESIKTSIRRLMDAKNVGKRTRQAMGLNKLDKMTENELMTLWGRLMNKAPNTPSDDIFLHIIEHGAPIDTGRGNIALDYVRRIRDSFRAYGLEGLVYDPIKLAIGNANKSTEDMYIRLAGLKKQVSHIKGNEKRIFDILEGTPPDDAAEIENIVAGELRGIFDDYARRLDLEPEQMRQLYAPHIVKNNKIAGAAVDEKLAGVLQHVMPESVFNPFLLQRTADMEHIDDIWKAAAYYSTAAEKSIALNPILVQTKELYKFMTPQAKRFVNGYVKNILGERYGQKFLQSLGRPGAFILKFNDLTVPAIHRGILGAPLGMNDTSLLNFTQSLHTNVEIGPKATAFGAKKMATREGREAFMATGLHRNSLADEALQSLTGDRNILDKVLFWGFDKAELYNRGIAWYGGQKRFLDAAERMGMPINDAVRKDAGKYGEYVIWKTQFEYGPEDMAPILQNRGLRFATQFLSYTQNVASSQVDNVLQTLKNTGRAVSKDALPPEDDLIIALKKTGRGQDGVDEWSMPTDDWDFFRRYAQGEEKAAKADLGSTSGIDRANAVWQAWKRPAAAAATIYGLQVAGESMGVDLVGAVNPLKFLPIQLDNYSGNLTIRTSPIVGIMGDVYSYTLALGKNDRVLQAKALQNLGKSSSALIPGGRSLKKYADQFITQGINQGVNLGVDTRPSAISEVPIYFEDVLKGPDVSDIPLAYTSDKESRAKLLGFNTLGSKKQFEDMGAMRLARPQNAFDRDKEFWLYNLYEGNNERADKIGGKYGFPKAKDVQGSVIDAYAEKQSEKWAPKITNMLVRDAVYNNSANHTDIVNTLERLHTDVFGVEAPFIAVDKATAQQQIVDRMKLVKSSNDPDVKQKAANEIQTLAPMFQFYLDDDSFSPEGMFDMEQEKLGVE